MVVLLVQYLVAAPADSVVVFVNKKEEEDNERPWSVFYYSGFEFDWIVVVVVVAPPSRWRLHCSRSEEIPPLSSSSSSSRLGVRVAAVLLVVSCIDWRVVVCPPCLLAFVVIVD